MYEKKRKGSVQSLFYRVVVLVVFLSLAVSALAFPQEMQIGVYANTAGVLSFWDPSDTFGDEAIWTSNVYETLLKYDWETLEPKPLLATGWGKSEDSLSWTFYLQEGVKFHTGKEMDAAVVKACVERTMERGQAASYLLSPIKQIEVVDNYTIVFHLEYPVPFDLVAAAEVGVMNIFDPEPDHDWYDQGNDSGCGPYVVESHEGTDQVVLTKFDDYWGGWGDKPNHFEKVVITAVREASTRTMMIEEGEADITVGLPSTTIERLRGTPDVDIIDAHSWRNYLLMFNTEKGPLTDSLVRRALCYTIPYEEIIETMGRGIQPRGIVPTGLWGYSDRVMQYTFDLETARELLRLAGYPDGGFSLLITLVAGDDEERAIVDLWKSKLARLNINLDVRAMPWGSIVSMALADDPNERQDVCVFGWWPEYADPASFFVGMFITDAVYGYAYYNNPTFDGIVEAAQKMAGIDHEVATNLYIEAQNLMMVDMPGVSVIDVAFSVAKATSLKGYVSNPIVHSVYWYDCYRGEE